ncbi:MAG: 3-methyl-2-oxobutanoate hydroxymethyltransferase [Oscillospiraceae bacterium]|nr:3-methyl-2-oxobutanoate hydroxymethyltransferase [Oscillospiraceae bacterium]
MNRKKITAKTIRGMKNKEKIAMLTAYDYPMAKIVDESGCDMILVGDSLGNVVLGYENTTHVTMEDMLHHTKAVSRGVKNAMIVTDMPFLSCHLGVYKAVENAGRLISEGNAQAVKIEGGEEVAEVVKAICNAGIPVVGHLGLTPQSVNQFGGYGMRAKEEKEAEKLISDAKVIEAAGAFCIVLECIPKELAERVSREISIPTIGIGAGGGCDGQVLVIYDMLGLFCDYVPAFVKKYADMDTAVRNGVVNYIDEVKKGVFPQ